MRLLGTLVVVLGVLLPASARAQSVKMADLAGTWVVTSSKAGMKSDSLSDDLHKGNNDTIVIRPDSMFRWPNDKFFRLYGLTGDSLMLTKEARYKVTLKDQQLTLNGILTPNRLLQKIVAKRVDAPKPTP